MAFNALLKIGPSRLESLLKTPNIDDQIPAEDEDFDGSPSKLAGLPIPLLHAIKCNVPKDADIEASEFINNMV